MSRSLPLPRFLGRRDLSLLVALAQRRKVLVLPMALSLFLVASSPASAADVALAGMGTAPSGQESITTDPANPPPGPPLCLRVAASTYTFDIDQGVFEGAHAAAVYTVGATKPVITFSTQEDYFISPEGTYGERVAATGVCNPATFGPLGPVATGVTVTTAGTGAGIDCATVTAQFYRVNTELFFDWTGSCDVVGNTVSGTGSTPASTQHTFRARIIPPGQPQDGEWKYAYAP